MYFAHHGSYGDLSQLAGVNLRDECLAGMFADHVNDPIPYCRELEAHFGTPVFQEVVQAHQRLIVESMELYETDVLPFVHLLAQTPQYRSPYPSNKVHPDLARIWLGIRIKTFHSKDGSLAPTEDISQLRGTFGILGYYDLQRMNRYHLSVVLETFQYRHLATSPGYLKQMDLYKRYGVIAPCFPTEIILCEPKSFTTKMLRALCALYLCVLGDGMTGLNLDAAMDERVCPWFTPGPEYIDG